MPPPLGVVCILGIATTLGGAAVSAYGWGHDQDTLILGVTIFLVGLMIVGSGAFWRLICQRFQPWQDTWELASDAGYSRGYEEGRKAARPVVVRLSDRSRADRLSDGPVA